MSNTKRWCQIHIGKVIAVSRWSDTHISSSGGGGFIGRHGGHIHAPTISSEVSQKIELFSLGDNGKETNIVLANASISFREGSNLLAVWGAEFGGENGTILYVENLDTHEVYAPATPVLIEGWYGAYTGLGITILLTIFATNLLVGISDLMRKQHYDIGGLAAFGGFLIFAIAWPTLNRYLWRQLISNGKRARQPFVDEIITQAALKDIHFVADALAPLRLRRTKTKTPTKI